MLSAAGIVLGIVVVIAITGATGYFVAQEFAFIAADRSRLKARAQTGDRASTRALRVTGRTSFMLSGAQLGITVTGLLVGYVAEPLIGRGLSDLLGGVGVPSGVGVTVGVLIAVGFSTVVQMIFGELFPKNLAIARPEPVALALARSTEWYLKLFGWLITLFDRSSELLLRALRIEPVHDVDHAATPRDLEHIVEQSRNSGELPRELSTLLERILDFPTRTAGHAMVPRSRVDAVNLDDRADHILERMRSGHTRYPVTGAAGDDLHGVIHLHDLLDSVADVTARDLLRPAIVVPEGLPLTDVHAQLSAAREEMALVIDEYGGFAGLLTTEDLAEQLVGEIHDEHDSDDPAGVIADGDGWLVPGSTRVDEAARLTGRDLPESAGYETIAGLLIAAFVGLPTVGQTVTVALPRNRSVLVTDTPETPFYADFEVREIDRRVPSLVRMTVRRGGTDDE